MLISSGNITGERGVKEIKTFPFSINIKETTEQVKTYKK